MPYKTCTIGSVVREIAPNNSSWFIPAMQRPYVWEQADIIRLFQSIYQNFPIGTSLVWPTTYNNPTNHGAKRIYWVGPRQGNNMPPASAAVPEGQQVTLVLDGQQRLTSLCVGIYGAWVNGERQSKLYFDPTIPRTTNLRQRNNVRQSFKFLPADAQPDPHLISCSSILSWEDGDEFRNFVADYIQMAGDDTPITGDEMRANIQSLRDSIWQTEAYCYGVYHATSLQDALAVFELSNDTGRPLEKTDLIKAMLQIAWNNTPLREELPTRSAEANTQFFGNQRPFRDKTYLNLFLLTSQAELPTNYRLSDFTPEIVEQLQGYWGIFHGHLTALLRQLNNWGLTNNKCLSSTNALIPILAIQVWHNLGYGQENIGALTEIEKIRQWLLVVLLNGSFGGQSPRAIGKALEIIRANGHRNYFPKKELFNGLENEHNNDFRSREGLDRFLESLDYSDTNARHRIRLLLMLLKNNIQPANISYEIDHIFPRAQWGAQYPSNINKPWNLELLTNEENARKTNQTPAILWGGQFTDDWLENNLLNVPTLYNHGYAIWDDPERLWYFRREAMVDRFCAIMEIE